MLLALFAAPAQSELACPESLDIGRAQVAPAGWERSGVAGSGTMRHQLRRVTFTDGHPREEAFLRPTSSRLGDKGDRTDLYVFSAVSIEGIALVCQYADTPQSLFRRIAATMCEITINDQEKRVRRISCR